MNNIYYLLLSYYIIISSVSFFCCLISPITLQLVKNLSISQRYHTHTHTNYYFHHPPSQFLHTTQLTTEVYRGYLDKGFDIRPTIAVTKAHIDLPETREAVAAGRLVPDGKILLASGKSLVSKAAIEPVWYLPEIARRFGCTEAVLRQSIFRMTNGMYPELVTRPDIKIFLPPIGGLTIYIWGDPDTIPDEDIELTCRVHDECNGSDVFGSDICTCRPYLTHAIEECIKTARE
jgi:GTP cyclohydrolase II